MVKVRQAAIDLDRARQRAGQSFVNCPQLYSNLKESLRTARTATAKVKDENARAALEALTQAVELLTEIQHAALNAAGEKPPPLSEAENGQ